MTHKRFHVPDSVIGILIIVAWVSLLFADTISKKITAIIDDEDWMYVELDIEGSTINYTRDIKRWLHGPWTAVIQQRNPDWPNGWEGICNASDTFTYKPDRAGVVKMSYGFFFNYKCEQPLTPHRICVSYTLTDLEGSTKPFGPFCSEEVIP